MSAGEFLFCTNLKITELESRVRKNKKLTTKAAAEFLNTKMAKVLTKTEPKDKLVYDPKQVDGQLEQ